MAFVKRRFLSNKRFNRALTVLEIMRFLVGRRFPAVLFMCLAWMPVGAATGDDPEHESDQPDVVTFALPDVRPWAYEDADGTQQGSLVTIVRRLSELTGVPVEVHIRPQRRALIELHSGDVNFSLLYQSPAQDNQAINVAHLVNVDLVLAAPADTRHTLTLEALEGKRVGYTRGTYLGEAFEQNAGVQKIPVAVISQSIEMLRLGRLSAMLASDHGIIRTLQSMGLQPDELRYARHVRGQAGVLYMSRRAQRPDVAEKFRKAILQMKQNNELDRIFFGEAGRPQYEVEGEPTAQ
jgi:ABC-type amino acid transport substrate-binding protein